MARSRASARLTLGWIVLLFSTTGCAQGTSEDQWARWPTSEWATSTPEAQGMNSGDLADALNFVRENQVNIHSLTIVRNGFVMLDMYFYPFSSESRHDLASATKSVVAVLVGLATDDGFFDGLRQSVISTFPAEIRSRLDRAVLQVRIGDLLSMRSGFDCGLRRGEPELRDMRTTASLRGIWQSGRLQ